MVLYHRMAAQRRCSALIFDRLRRTPDDLLSVVRDFDVKGVAFEIFISSEQGGSRKAITFPVTQMPLSVQALLLQKELPKLYVLQELWMNSMLAEEEPKGCYVLDYDKIDDLEPEVREILDIPEREKVEVYLDSYLAVGNTDFTIRASITHPRYGRLDPRRRRGHAIRVSGNQYVLVFPEVARLLDRLEQRPREIQEQFPYVAEVKALAESVDARLDPYLQKERYLFPTNFDVNVKAENPSKVVLIPEIEGLPAEFDLEKLAKTGRSYTYDARGNRYRVFVGPELQRNLNNLLENPVIEGTAVPQFIHNPAAFLPSDLEIDLDKFSDRVKGLDIQVYRAKPYIQITPRGQGWFEIDAGIRLSRVNGTTYGQEEPSGHEGFPDDVLDSDEQFNMDVNRLAGLAEKAPQEGGWVLDGDKWIYIPKDARKVSEAASKSSGIAPGGRVSEAHLRYILEIYTNIDALEYDSEFSRLARELLDDSSPALDYTLPRCFKGDLYDHQAEGYTWLQQIYGIPVGGLLADEMGLGKTIQVIAFMALLFEQEALSPALVICPKTLVDNWKSEIARFLPQAKVYEHTGPNRIRAAELFGLYDVVVATYETLVRDELILGQVDWSMCVCDEAQRIKNFTTAAARVCKVLKARLRLALTGTPVENSLGDLWSIVDYVQPGLLGSYNEFRNRFERPLSLHPSETIRQDVERELIARLYLVYKRRTKKEILKDLPPKKEERTHIPLGKLQEQLYRSIIAEIQGGNRQQGQVLAAIRRLLNVCAHPFLETQQADTASPTDLKHSCPKLVHTLDLLHDIRKSGEKCLIFTDRRAMQRILARVILNEFGFMPTVINGESVNRLELVESFNQKGGFSAMILSPRAAGTGLTITGANHVIHYTRWWNPAVENQATDRIHRIGQTKPVFVHIPICTADTGRTAEEVLDQLLSRKSRLAESVIVPSSGLNITEKEIAEALGISIEK